MSATEDEFFTSKGAFQFNHIDPARKAPHYDNLIRRKLSTTQLDELDKCNLLCASCHPIWTYQKLRCRGSAIDTRLPDGRSVTTRFSNHGLIKRKDGQPQVYLFADTPQRLDSYCYRFGSRERVFKTGIELERNLVNLMLATRKRGLLRPFGTTRDWYTRPSDWMLPGAALRFCVRFPLIKFEGRENASSPAFFWVRNGKAIIKDYGVRETGVVTAEVEYAEVERAAARAAG